MKRRAAILIGMCTLMLAGCGKTNDEISSFINTYVEDSVLMESNIQNDESYAEYERISKEETINEEGFFVSDDVDYTVLEDTDAVHVTFAANSYITVEYFDDPTMTNLLNSGGAYLHENDCIYANIQEVNNPNTDSYQFSTFEVWEYDENGKKKNELETPVFDSEDGLVYQIPMNFNGKEIAIVPLGEYTSRDIELNDFYRDNNGVEKSLAGTWDINGEITTNNSKSVSPVAPYTVTYLYNPDKYVFVTSDPVCLNNNEVYGIVSFEEFSADQNICKFSVELREKSGDQEFDPGKYNVEHADIVYKYQGVEIDDPTPIPNGSKISYEITHVDDGYWVPGDQKGEIVVDDVAEFIENLVCKKEMVKITLPQPERGGTIIYSLDGKILTGDSVEALIGSEIKMTFECKNGWRCDKEDGTTYKVAAIDIQRANVEGKDVNEVFFEQENKPIVILKIDKSVSTYTEFDIDTVDVDKAGLKLEDEKKTREVFNERVGTKDDLVVTARGTLDKNKALRIEIKKETKDGKKEDDIRYLKKLPGSLTVPLYITDSDTVYKTVALTVSKVNVVLFSCPTIKNGNITVETTDLTDNRYLKSGDVIEDSRKVKISISAKSSNYVKDSGKADVYSDTMKYSKFVSDIQSILSKHPIKKLCCVTLDASDPYGTVTYKIDGKVTEPGTYKIKEEQKLEIAYEITDGKHVIVREGANWFEDRWNAVQSKTKQSVEIPIVTSLDGNKVTREMYISVKDK